MKVKSIIRPQSNLNRDWRKEKMSEKYLELREKMLSSIKRARGVVL